MGGTTSLAVSLSSCRGWSECGQANERNRKASHEVGTTSLVMNEKGVSLVPSTAEILHHIPSTFLDSVDAHSLERNRSQWMLMHS